MSTKKTEDSPDDKKPVERTGFSMFISASMVKDVRPENEHPAPIPYDPPPMQYELHPSQMETSNNTPAVTAQAGIASFKPKVK